MAPLSPKRRKLDHGDHKDPSYSSPAESENDLLNDHSLVDLPDQAPVTQPKHMQTRSTKPQDGDDAALYAGGVYKSSLFKLQVDELLVEVQPNYEKRLNGVNDALRRLKTLIEGIGEREPLSVRPKKRSTLAIYLLTLCSRYPKLLSPFTCRTR